MAGSVIKGITVVIDGQTTQLSKALAKLREQTKGLASQLTGVNKLLAVNPTGLTMIGQKQAILNRSIATYQNKLNDAIKAEREAYSKRDQWSKAERENYENLQREVESTKQKLSSLTDEAVAFGSAASAKTIAAKAQYAALGDTLVSVGKKLMVLSASTALIGGYSIYAAAKYESAFAGVRKTVDATEAEFQDLSDTIRQMALEKPIDATDIAYAAELGGQLGIAVENLDQFASVIADLDVATNLDLEDASMKLAQFANIANVSETDFDRLGSTIVDLGNNSATTETKIMNMAMRIAGSGSNIGLSAQEVLALATSLSSVGIEAEMGGNAISTIMNRIDKDVALSTETLQVWADTAGMSAEEFAAAWDNSDTVMDTMLAVVDGMATYRDEGGNLNTLLADMNISYMRQVDTMQRLSRTGDIVNEMVDLANNAWDENIALTREANRRYETTENQLKLVKNNFKEIAIQLGEIMTPTVKEFSGNMVETLQDFQELDDATKQNTVRFLAFATAAGPVTLALAGVAKGISWLIGLYASGITKVALLTRGTASFTGAADAAAAATARAAAKAKLLNTALATTGTIATALAIVAIALLIKGLKDAAEHEEALRKATDGLRDSTTALDDSMLDAQGTMESLKPDNTVKTYNQIRDSINECIESQGELAESLEETWSSINGSEYALGKYAETIRLLTDGMDENGNAAKLNADEQAALRAAVAGMNDIMGTNIKVIDAENGLLSDNTEYLLANADAWIAQAKARAAAESLNEVMKQQWTNEYNLEQAEEAYSVAKATAEANPHDSSAQRVLADAKEQRDEMQALFDAGEDKAAWFTAKVAEYSEAVESSTLALADFVDETDVWSETLEEMGIDVDAFILKLSELGFTTADMSAMTEEQVRLLASSFGLSAEEMIAAFEKAGLEVPEALLRLVGAIEEEVTIDDMMQQKAEEGIAALADGLDGASDSARQAASRVREEVLDDFQWKSDFEEAGRNAIRGLIAGLNLSTNLGSQLSTAASNLATSTLESFRFAAGESSPWSTMIQSGKFATEGLAIGFDRYSYIAEASAARFGMRTLGAVNGAMSPADLANLTTAERYGSAISLTFDGAASKASAPVSQATTNYYMIDGAVVNSTPEIEAKFYDLMTELKRYAKMEGGE